MYRTLHEKLSSRGEVAHARWHLAAELGLRVWPERDADATTLALELGPLAPRWLDIEPIYRRTPLGMPVRGDRGDS